MRESQLLLCSFPVLCSHGLSALAPDFSLAQPKPNSTDLNPSRRHMVLAFRQPWFYQAPPTLSGGVWLISCGAPPHTHTL